MLRQLIYARSEACSWYIVEHEATVRETACIFNISKSTVHKDVTERIMNVNMTLAMEVRKVLDKNTEERHLRGGEATKRKYKLLKLEKGSS